MTEHDRKRRQLLRAAGLSFAAGAVAPYAGLAATTDIDVMSYGAKGDGSTNDAAAIQRAIDACSWAGGGRVVLAGGKTYLSGTIELKPHVDLHIESGSALKTIGDRNQLRTRGALIFAKNADGIAVTGGGKIEGNFLAFFHERQEGGYKVIGAFLGPYDPLDPPSKADPNGRPRMILFLSCNGVTLRDFTIHNAPTWTIHPVGCTNVLVDGITIDNDMEVPNCDGIGIDHCRSVRVSNCHISSGDDCIVVRASRMFGDYGPCEDVTITNCHLTSSSAAIKVEPEGALPVRNVAISNCVITRSNRGICVTNRDGTLVENVVFSNMTIETELRLSMWWGEGTPIYITNQSRSRSLKIGPMRNLRFENILCHGENGAFLYGGAESFVENVTFNGVELHIGKTSKIKGGFYDLRPGELNPGVFRHRIAGIYGMNVNGLVLRDVSVAWGENPPDYYGPALDLTRVTGLIRDGFRGHAAHQGKEPDVVIDGKAE